MVCCQEFFFYQLYVVYVPSLKSCFLAESFEKSALLAIAWDRRVQVAKLVKSELKVFGKWTLDSAAVGVVWLDDQVMLHSVGLIIRQSY